MREKLNVMKKRKSIQRTEGKHKKHRYKMIGEEEEASLKVKLGEK